MRTNFYELLAKRNFSVEREYETLWRLFKEEASVPRHSYLIPMAEYINHSYFRKLAFRGSCTSIDELISAVGIRSSSRNLNDLFVFCEFLIAVLPKEVEKDRYYQNQRETILGNINYILERTNHEIRRDPNGNSIIVEKNKASTLAAQLVDDEVIAFNLIEYNHFALKGDLESKKKLLFSIAAYIEPILKSKVLQQNGYKQLESDAGFLFNNFHIRHNNKVGVKAQDYIVAAKDTELEEWYDKAYEVALSVIIINDYLSIGKDIADIKTKYIWNP